MIGYSHLGDYAEPKDNNRDNEMNNMQERLIQSKIRELQTTLVSKAGQDTREIAAYVQQFETVLRSSNTSQHNTLLAQYKANAGVK